MPYTIEVNGRRVALDLPGDTPLLWALREGAGLTGTKVKLHRITCAVDCGLAVNPDSVAAQMEGASPSA